MTKTIAQRVSRNVEHVVDEVVHDMGHARKRFEAKTEGAIAAVNDWAADARDRTTAVAKSTARTMRDRPFTSIAVVGGLTAVLGFLIGRLTTRKG